MDIKTNIYYTMRNGERCKVFLWKSALQCWQGYAGSGLLLNWNKGGKETQGNSQYDIIDVANDQTDRT
jgi:hypothetical protein